MFTNESFFHGWSFPATITGSDLGFKTDDELIVKIKMQLLTKESDPTVIPNCASRVSTKYSSLESRLLRGWMLDNFISGMINY